MRAMILGVMGMLLISGCGLVDAPGTPVVEAHRGAAGYWPQNSRAAMVGSVEAGFPGLEFDLVLTSDGVPVLSHEPWLHEDLCTTVDGEAIEGRVLIQDIALEDLQADYVCGGVSDEEFADAEVIAESIMTFAELLEVIEGSAEDMLLHIDVKYEPDGTTPAADVMAEAVLATWYAAALPNPWFVSANQPAAIEAFETAADGDITTSLIWPRFHPDLNDTKIALTTEFKSVLGLVEYVDEARSCGADGIAVPYQLIDRRQVDAARDVGLQVQVWTPNTPEQLEEYCSWPVDAVITDFPEDAPCLAGEGK